MLDMGCNKPQRETMPLLKGTKGQPSCSFLLFHTQAHTLGYNRETGMGLSTEDITGMYLFD